MKAAAIDKFGPAAVLTVHSLPVPEAGPREVIIALHGAGVGVWDALVRDGSWRPFGKPKFPLVLGTDGAGLVAAKGSGARRFRLNDRAWACDYANPKGGFYAEYVVVNESHVGRVPRHLDLVQAGAGVTTGLTAEQGIARLRVRRGETVLIFGATGGVGTLAIQFAKWRGARVLATATGRGAANLVRLLGAEASFDARARDAVEQLRRLTPGGIDAVLALAGGDMLNRTLDFVRNRGRVAYPNGVEPPPRRNRRYRLIAYDANNSARDLARLERAAVEVRLRVPIAKVYPLAQAARAHAQIERGHILGRIVLRIRRGK
jgi:NADPH2:quinone reductase